MRGLRHAVAVLIAASSLAPLSAQTPTGTVRGRVTDATSQPLGGVTLSIGTRAALSQTDGRYVITNVPAGSDSLHARLIGYAPAGQSVTVAGGETVTADVTMSAQAVRLSEIVVVGYGTKRAGELTGSQAQVGSADFNPGNISSPQQLIANKIPGVQVVENNQPGGGMSIRIRGH